ELVQRLANGLAVFLIDGCCRAVAISTQEMPQRSVSTPDGEGNIHGPQEAFTELLRNNVSLLRRQFRTASFVAEAHTARTHARTEYCLCYDSACAAPDTVLRSEERRVGKASEARTEPGERTEARGS